MTRHLWIGFRMAVDEIGLDPWDLEYRPVMERAERTEGEPVSRFRFGSPCRFVRWVDVAVHVLLPEMLAERHPLWACYLWSTSPRWGRSWRGW